MNINKYIDHTLLKADATKAEITQLCQEAISYQFFAVCVNSSYVSFAKELLKNSPVKIASVIGFPLGAMSTKAKIFEATQAINDGADEIDMVINLGSLKDQQWDNIQEEISQIKLAIKDTVLKVIIETCLLTDDEKKKMCEIVINSGAEYIKTSTGFSTHGATIDDVQLMIDNSFGKIAVKASGGIKNIESAQKYIEMGVSRLGTSSGVSLINNQKIDTNY